MLYSEEWYVIGMAGGKNITAGSAGNESSVPFLAPRWGQILEL